MWYSYCSFSRPENRHHPPPYSKRISIIVVAILPLHLGVDKVIWKGDLDMKPACKVVCQSPGALDFKLQFRMYRMGNNQIINEICQLAQALARKPLIMLTLFWHISISLCEIVFIILQLAACIDKFFFLNYMPLNCM